MKLNYSNHCCRKFDLQEMHVNLRNNKKLVHDIQMSYDDRFQVGDLPGWISITPEEQERIAKEERLRLQRTKKKEATFKKEIKEIDSVTLFNNINLSAQDIIFKGISSNKWKRARHEATKLIEQQNMSIEDIFIQKCIGLGRKYAVCRYAKWENHSYPSAFTATLRHGIRSILFRYIGSEKILGGRKNIPNIQVALYSAMNLNDIAYQKTKIVQKIIHETAIDQSGPGSNKQLCKNDMREILSLCRLFFLWEETNISSVEDLKDLTTLYAKSRLTQKTDIFKDEQVFLNGRYISNWSDRHRHSLIYLFPYSFRKSITRCLKQCEKNETSFSRDSAISELALLICEKHLMRPF